MLANVQLSCWLELDIDWHRPSESPMQGAGEWGGLSLRQPISIAPEVLEVQVKGRESKVGFVSHDVTSALNKMKLDCWNSALSFCVE